MLSGIVGRLSTPRNRTSLNKGEPRVDTGGMEIRLMRGILCVALVSGVLAPTVASASAATFSPEAHCRAATMFATKAAPSTSADPQYGVLIANPVYRASDYSAGARLAMVSLDWSQWEPSNGSFSDSYIAQEASIVAGYRNAGFTIGINLGLNHAPAWALALPEGQLVDQLGHSSGTINLEFSQSARLATQAYIDNVQASVGSVSYYTISFSNSSEAVYPSTSANQWWAFDAAAQGDTSGLPAGTAPSPMPGWVPGSTTWDGSAVTVPEVQSWFNWYEGALASALGWEMSTIRAAGFAGNFQLQLAGDGANPWVYTNRIAADLAPESYDPYFTLNGGAVYQVLLDDMPSLSGVVIDVTSVGDGSGTPADNLCTAADSSVNWQTDSQVDDWSSIRWLAYLAGQHGLPVIGESTGQNSASQMALDFSLVHGCDLIGLMWAFDSQLYGGKYATVADYAQQIGTPIAVSASLSPTSHVYSTRSKGTTSAAASFVVTNTGTGSLTISSVAESGTAFDVVNDTCLSGPLAPSASCSLGATFSPPADSSYTGTVTIHDNAPSSLPVIQLSGQALG